MSEEKIIEEKTLSTEEMLKKSLQWSQLVYEQNKKIKRRLDLIIWGGILKWVLILVPIILSIIFLPALLKPYWDQYSGLLGNGAGGIQSDQLKNLLQGVSPAQVQEAMKLIGK